MRLTFKNILTIGILIVVGIAAFVVYKHFTKQTIVVPTEKDNALDSLNYYIAKKDKADKESKISGDSVTYYANRIDTLNKIIASDSFGADVLRSVQRARIKADILRAEVRDSAGRQHP